MVHKNSNNFFCAVSSLENRFSINVDLLLVMRDKPSVTYPKTCSICIARYKINNENLILELIERTYNVEGENN